MGCLGVGYCWYLSCCCFSQPAGAVKALFCSHQVLQAQDCIHVGFALGRSAVVESLMKNRNNNRNEVNEAFQTTCLLSVPLLS